MMRSLLLALVLIAGAVLSVASNWENPNERPIEPIEPTARDRIDETWVVANVYEGQTAVSRYIQIRLTVGARDFVGGDTSGLWEIALRRGSGALVAYDLEIGPAQTTVIPREILAPDEYYQLDLWRLAGHIDSQREVPFLIGFSTASSPRVMDVWRNEDTLIVQFSEPMDPRTLYPGHDSVDLLWEDEAGLHSLAAERNAATLAWDTDGELFFLGPLGNMGPGDQWLKIGVDVAAITGVPLDGDGNGDPGTTTDDYLARFNFARLPTCFSRFDMPEPCLLQEEIPDFGLGGWNDGWW